MKEKLTRNIGLKVLSIILATLLWLIITNVDDPLIPKPFRNVPVEILNANVISAKNQVYDITEGETINFTVEARRKIADTLTASDFIVTADFAHLSDVNAVSIDITCPRYGNEVVITDGKNQTMKIIREFVSEKPFKVDVIQRGEPAKGFYVGEATASPNIIQVSGPKGRIDKIESVAIEVDVSGVNGSYHTVASPKVLDKNGKEIDASKLTFSEQYITANITVYKTKTIDLQIVPSGDPAYGYVVTNIEYEPKNIVVAGPDDILNNISTLSIPEKIAGADANVENAIDLQEALPEGLILVGEDKTAVINITIEKLETSEIMIQPGDINVRNKPASLKITYNSTGPITLKVTGPGSLLDKLEKSTLKPYIDLSSYTLGTYTIPVKVELADNMNLTNSPMVNISLTQ